MNLVATRLLDEPIIRAHMDARMGDNICGPAIIRTRPWMQDRLGEYYLYFADHKGRYIRLAYANSLTGPWTMHTPGVLELSDSHFISQDPPEPPEEERPAWAKRMKGGYLYAHIASPDVHVDDASKTVRMYYHGLLPNGDQQTRSAASADGLSFTAHEPLLGPPYFRAFTCNDAIFAITWGGEVWRADDWQGPFERIVQLLHFDPKEGIGEGFRHGEVHRVDDTLYVLFTRIGDRPERIVYVTVDLTKPCEQWQASEVYELLQPELDWEGTDQPLLASTMGAEPTRVRQLRDPCVFVDEGRTYLLYCGAGENAIGLAELTGF